jgi:hypothetical protein
MAVEARAPCGDYNINKNNNRFYFYDSISWNKQESAREGELSEDRFMTPRQ